MRTIMQHLIDYHERGTDTEAVKDAADRVEEELEKMEKELDFDSKELDSLIGYLQIANFDEGFQNGFVTAVMLFLEVMDYKEKYFRKD